MVRKCWARRADRQRCNGKREKVDGEGKVRIDGFETDMEIAGVRSV